MKPSKKILIAVTSLLTISFFSTALSGGTILALGWTFWKSFWFFFALQIFVPLVWNKYIVEKNNREFIEEYSKKPFKSYLLELKCGHCGHANQVEINLDDTEFTCKNCSKDNGVHVNFVVAAITAPINTDLL